ncbi:hypothetical protein DM01DRAFT_1281356, partial [Hesseltinella vesiculosa]
STLHRFVRDYCNFTFKKAQVCTNKSRSIDKAQARYDRAIEMGHTDMDFTSNCVFIDEAIAFSSTKQLGARSKKGECTDVVIPQTRARTTTILGAMTAFGVINVKARPLFQSFKRMVVGSIAKRFTGSFCPWPFVRCSESREIP